MNRIFVFTGPQISIFSVLGLIMMVLGAIVCFKAAWVKKIFTGREGSDEEAVPVKLIGLALACAGFITVIFLKG